MQHFSFRLAVLSAVLLCGRGFAQESSTSVTLGDPSLTAGIPGVGLLTDDELNGWLENPANHQELDVSLPEGLKAASGNIHIPDDNPMTRAKIELGRQLYFDERLSSDNTVSCASCHDPDDGLRCRDGVWCRCSWTAGRS